jgi:hypothetical protein
MPEAVTTRPLALIILPIVNGLGHEVRILKMKSGKQQGGEEGVEIFL